MKIKCPFFEIHIFIILVLLFSSGSDSGEISSTNGGYLSSPHGFYRALAALEFGTDDATEMFRDLTAAADNVAGCSGKCKTPISIWMLRSIEPCDNLIKAECPLGLICCGDPQEGRSSIGNSASPTLENASTFYIPLEDILKIRELKRKANGTID